MSSIGGGRRPLTRSVCAAARVAGDAGGALHKHNCILNHASPVMDLVFAHPQSPISWLSNEELLLVFEEALYSAFADPATFTSPWKPALIVTISHVCRRWRGLVLSCSCLWTHILACSLSEVQRHLSRSATHPLMVYGVFYDPKVTVGPSSVDGDGTAIVNGLVDSTHRWKVLRWLDCSANNTTNVLRLMKTSNAYPLLKNLKIIFAECVTLGSMEPADASAAVLFPALKHIRLIRGHPMFLPHSPMRALQCLKLEGPNELLLFSQLFALLYRSPALRLLSLHSTLPTIDLLGPTSDPSSTQLFPGCPLSLHGRRFALPQLARLSLNPAPATDLWLLFALLDLPAFESLDLHLLTYPHAAHWPGITPDGRAVRTTFRYPNHPSAPAVCLPALRALRVAYGIPFPAPTPYAPPALPQPQHLVFPALIDLQITHTFVHAAQITDMPLPPPPQPLPLRPFDELLRIPSFTHVRRLTLMGCALPLNALCDALRTRFPALEVLALCACPGAGPLVCTLAPEACRDRCERPGSGDAWIGVRVREVVVKHCGDVRAGCLRKVIEARLRVGRAKADPSASGSATADDSESEADADADGTGAGPASASGPEVTGAPSAGSGEPAAGSDSAGELVTPQRLVMVRVLECARVTREDARALEAIRGAPMVAWMGSGGERECSWGGSSRY